MRHLTRLQNLQHQIDGMAARSDGAVHVLPQVTHGQDRHVRFAILCNVSARFLPASFAYERIHGRLWQFDLWSKRAIRAINP
ncbi:hypothetical protein PFWH6_0919 [Pseudomonas fluorescens WH6]|nr:hypothetical protein PFWH6_0919 [Pseudomonas fluorescens WH6]